jgi:hypothetical protein
MKIHKHIGRVLCLLLFLVLVHCIYKQYNNDIKNKLENFNNHLISLPVGAYNNLITNGTFNSGTDITQLDSNDGISGQALIIGIDTPEIAGDSNNALNISKHTDYISYYNLKFENISSNKFYVLNVWVYKQQGDSNINLFKFLYYNSIGTLINQHHTNGIKINTPQSATGNIWEELEVIVKVPEGISSMNIKFGNIPTTSFANIFFTGIKLFQFLEKEPAFPLSNDLLIYLNQDNENSLATQESNNWLDLVNETIIFEKKPGTAPNTSLFEGPVLKDMNNSNTAFTIALRLNLLGKSDDISIADFKPDGGIYYDILLLDGNIRLRLNDQRFFVLYKAGSSNYYKYSDLTSKDILNNKSFNIVLDFDGNNNIDMFLNNKIQTYTSINSTTSVSNDSSITSLTYPLSTEPIRLYDNTVDDVNKFLINKFVVYNRRLDATEREVLFAYFNTDTFINNTVTTPILRETDYYIESCVDGATDCPVSEEDINPSNNIITTTISSETNITGEEYAITGEEYAITGEEYDISSTIAAIDTGSEYLNDSLTNVMDETIGYDMKKSCKKSSNDIGRVKNININIINDSKLGNKGRSSGDRIDSNKNLNMNRMIFDDGLRGNQMHEGGYNTKDDLDSLRNEILLLKHRREKDEMVEQANNVKPNTHIQMNSNVNTYDNKKEGWGDGWTYISPKYWRLPQPQPPICLTDQKANVCPTVLNAQRNHGDYLAYNS